MKTLYEKNLEDSFKRFEELYGKPVNGKTILEQFFPHKIAKYVDKLELVSGRKTAIILLGESCCGKSTFAQEFIIKNPNFRLISMDDCAIQDISEMDEEQRIVYMVSCMENADKTLELGNARFGKMIETGEDVIIDGGWLHFNARGALLKTLAQLGFYTCIFSFLSIPRDLLEERMQMRAVESAAECICKMEDKADLHLSRQAIQLCADEWNVSPKRAINKIRKSVEYKLELETILNENKREMKDSMLWMQMVEFIFLFGADDFFAVSF